MSQKKIVSFIFLICVLLSCNTWATGVSCNLVGKSAQDLFHYLINLDPTCSEYEELVRDAIKSVEDLTKQYSKLDGTLLHYAVQKRNIILINILLDAGININIKGAVGESDGLTPLHCAIFSESVDIVKHLLSKGADANAQVTDNTLMNGFTPLQLVVLISGNIPDDAFRIISMASDLIAAGAKINTRISTRILGTFSGFTVLHLAAFKNNLELVKLLVEKNADPTMFVYFRNAMRRADDLSTNKEIKKIIKDARDRWVPSRSELKSVKLPRKHEIKQRYAKALVFEH